MCRIQATVSDDGGSDDGSTILDEWNSDRDYPTRVANLTDGSGSSDRLNGDYFLKLGRTVFHDRTRDMLFGGEGENWLLAENLDVIGRRPTP